MNRSEWTETDPALIAQRDRLLETLRGYGRVAVAFSGGVDSTVVAQAAQLALGDAAVAVTAVSDSLAAGELEEAEALAERIGIRHRVIRTEEFADPNYLRNNPDRCYFCKSELYGRLSGLLGELGVDVIASGANTDDAGDHRPGHAGRRRERRPPPAPGVRSWSSAGAIVNAVSDETYTFIAGSLGASTAIALDAPPAGTYEASLPSSDWSLLPAASVPSATVRTDTTPPQGYFPLDQPTLEDADTILHIP